MNSFIQPLAASCKLLNTDDTYLEQVIGYYHLQLLKHYDRLQHIVPLKLPLEDVKLQRWGYCDRTLGLHLPSAETLEGGAIRGALQRLGVFKPNGRELFRGCIVIPVLDETGAVIAIKGKRVATRLPRRCPRWIDWFRQDEQVCGGRYAQHS